MGWASGNPRIARAFARWAGAIERESARIASPEMREFLQANLDQWDGSPMPLSRSWVEEETAELSGAERELARFGPEIKTCVRNRSQGEVYHSFVRS